MEKATSSEVAELTVWFAKKRDRAPQEGDKFWSFTFHDGQWWKTSPEPKKENPRDPKGDCPVCLGKGLAKHMSLSNSKDPSGNIYTHRIRTGIKMEVPSPDEQTEAMKAFVVAHKRAPKDGDTQDNLHFSEDHWVRWRSGDQEVTVKTKAKEAEVICPVCQSHLYLEASEHGPSDWRSSLNAVMSFHRLELESIKDRIPPSLYQSLVGQVQRKGGRSRAGHEEKLGPSLPADDKPKIRSVASQFGKAGRVLKELEIEWYKKDLGL